MDKYRRSELWGELTGRHGEDLVVALASIFDRHVEPHQDKDPLEDTENFLRYKETLPGQFLMKAKELKTLRDLKATIRKLSRQYDELASGSKSTMWRKAEMSEQLATGDPTRAKDLERKGVIVPGAVDALAALNELSANSEAVVKLLDGVTVIVSKGSSVGKKPVEAWCIIWGASKVCLDNYGKINIPVHMKGTGPLHALLSDLFDLFEIEVSPEGAFNGWAQYVGRREKK